MNNENIPQSLKVALNVEDAEYRKAKLQATVLWAATMIAPLIGLGLWAVGIRLSGWMLQAIGLGVGVHALLYAVLPEARKMSTMRMQKYRELKAYRAARERLQSQQAQENSE